MDEFFEDDGGEGEEEVETEMNKSKVYQFPSL